MATPAGGPAAAAEAERLHPILDVFFSPSAAMDSLARKPRVLLALVVITAVTAGMMGVATQRGVMEQFMRKQVEKRLEQIPADQRERAMERALSIGTPIAVVQSLVGPTILVLVLSGLFLVLANVVWAAGVRFRQMMAVVAHSWLPMSLGALIGIPILLAKEPDTIDLQNVVPMANLSFLFDSTEQHKLYMVGSSIDLFSIWVMALLTLGLARLTGKSKGACLVAVLVPWALYVAIAKAWRG